MRLILVISIIQVVVACSVPDGRRSDDATTVIANRDTLNVSDPLEIKLSDTVITMTVSYAAIACGCPQWFDAKYKDVEFLDGVERFYLEPTSKDLINANGLWDGEHLPFTLKITGRFATGKGLPVTYAKGEPEKARIFWYNKLTTMSPFSK